MHMYFVDTDANVTLWFVDIQLCQRSSTQMYKTDTECYSRFRNVVLAIVYNCLLVVYKIRERTADPGSSWR